MIAATDVLNIPESPAFNAVSDYTTEQWFAVHTHARHEKMVAKETRHLGITTFMPVVRQVRQWSGHPIPD